MRRVKLYRVKGLCVLAVTAACLTPAESRAQVFTLACSGTAFTFDLNLHRPPAETFLIDVDFGRRTVRGFPRFDEMAMTQIAYSFVSFAGSYKVGPHNPVREAGGVLNHADGTLVLYVRTSPRPSEIAGLYQMKCRPLRAS